MSGRRAAQRAIGVAPGRGRAEVRRHTGDGEREVSRDGEPAHLQRAGGGAGDDRAAAVDDEVQTRDHYNPRSDRAQHDADASRSRNSRG